MARSWSDAVADAARRHVAKKGSLTFTRQSLIDAELAAIVADRAETQAAHIMSVEAGGPDVVNNGIALAGTVHWMFDRGLVSLSDEGDILLSRKINDIEGVEKLRPEELSRP